MTRWRGDVNEGLLCACAVGGRTDSDARGGSDLRKNRTEGWWFSAKHASAACGRTQELDRIVNFGLVGQHLAATILSVG